MLDLPRLIEPSPWTSAISTCCAWRAICSPRDRMKLALLALPLTLVACQAADSETPSIEKPTDSKADDPDKLCAALGEQPGCDVCDVAGWYGDGECDHFCTNPDTADCAVGPQDATAFLAATDVPAAKMSRYIDTYRLETNMVVTPLSSDDVHGWLDAKAPMIGTGLALHLTFRHDSAFTNTGANEETIVVDDHFQNGACIDGDLGPGEDDVDFPFAVYKWENLHATAVACPRGGSIRINPGTSDSAPMKVTFNVLWSDGSAWAGRSLTVDKPQ
jgi:hypothetical protein